VETLDRLEAPRLALGPLGLRPADRLPVRRDDQASTRVAELDAVSAGLPQVQEEGLLDRVFVRSGLDVHAGVEADIGSPQDLLTRVGRERDVVQVSTVAGPVLGTSAAR
jgi:hypothetical protein